MRWGRRSAGRLAALALAPAIALAALPPAAPAGTWIQVACQTPSGAAASSQGWTSASVGTIGPGSSGSAQCSPSTPMYAQLDGPVSANNTSEMLQYTPPAGSTLIGGTLHVTAYADGGSSTASGNSLLFEPAEVYPNDVIFQCAEALPDPCYGGNGAHYSGAAGLPANAGGTVTAEATCGTAQPSGSCNNGGSLNDVAIIQISSAQLVLANSAVPAGSGFGGTATQSPVSGTPHLLFTASDPNGPGVYTVTATVDGAVAYRATPNANGGECAPVGSSSGTLMFAYIQPCPPSTAVDVPVPVAALKNGKHELAVSVTDAAGNSATVYDATLEVSNPGSGRTSTGARRGIRAHFTIRWHYRRRITRLDAIGVTGVPKRATVHVSCRGRGCPRLAVRSSDRRHLRRLLAGLRGRRFHAGDRLLMTVSAPRRRSERIGIRIRNGALPVARLLSHR